MRSGPQERGGLLSRLEVPDFSVLRSRLFWALAAKLLTSCGEDPEPEEGGRWDTRGDGGAETSTCNAECAADGRTQGERWECDQAFDPETGRVLLPDEQAVLGQYSCKERTEGEGNGGSTAPGPDDPNRPACSATNERFVPLAAGSSDAGVAAAGTQSRTNGRTICSGEKLDCISARHGGGSGANCDEPLFYGEKAGANCRAQGCD